MKNKLQNTYLYKIIGTLSNNKFQITVQTYRIYKETEKVVSYYTEMGIVKKINKFKLYVFDTTTLNSSGFYTLYVYVTDKKSIQMYIDLATERLKRLCSTEYFKLIDAYKQSIKKPKVKKQNFSGKHLDDILNDTCFI